MPELFSIHIWHSWNIKIEGLCNRTNLGYKKKKLLSRLILFTNLPFKTFCACMNGYFVYTFLHDVGTQLELNLLLPFTHIFESGLLFSSNCFECLTTICHSWIVWINCFHSTSGPWKIAVSAWDLLLMWKCLRNEFLKPKSFVFLGTVFRKWTCELN